MLSSKAFHHSASRLSQLQERPNPQPPSLVGKGANFKASLLAGERFGERSKLYRTQGENRYIRKAKEYWIDYEKRENADQ